MLTKTAASTVRMCWGLLGHDLPRLMGWGWQEFANFVTSGKAEKVGIKVPSGELTRAEGLGTVHALSWITRPLKRSPQKCDLPASSSSVHLKLGCICSRWSPESELLPEQQRLEDKCGDTPMPGYSLFNELLGLQVQISKKNELPRHAAIQAPLFRSTRIDEDQGGPGPSHIFGKAGVGLAMA